MGDTAAPVELAMLFPRYVGGPLDGQPVRMDSTVNEWNTPPMMQDGGRLVSYRVVHLHRHERGRTAMTFLVSDELVCGAEEAAAWNALVMAGAKP